VASQFTTASGEVLYLSADVYIYNSAYEGQQQQLLDQLSDYIEITEATADGWGKVLIGHTMYSDTSSQWNGMLNTPAVSPSFDFTRINTRKYADYTEDTLLQTMKINDIEWSFYYSFGEYAPMLWAVPAQEDIALGAYLDYLMEDMGLTINEMAAGSPEINALLMDKLNIAVQLAAEHCFSNYHLYRANGNPTTYFPDEMEVSGGSLIPTDPIEPTDPMPTEPGTIYFDYYDAMLEFTIADRSFIILNWRDDVLLRQHYTGEDHVQIDYFYTVGQEEKTIDAVGVWGRKSELENLQYIKLDTIDLAQVDGTEVRQYDLNIPAGMELSNAYGQITAKITVKDLAVATLQVTNIQTINPPEGVTVTLRTDIMSVVIRGPQSLLQQVTPEDITIVVDLSNAQEGTATYNATVQIVDNFSDIVGAVGNYPVTVNIT
jgi:hypothetical protein